MYSNEPADFNRGRGTSDKTIVRFKRLIFPARAAILGASNRAAIGDHPQNIRIRRLHHESRYQVRGHLGLLNSCPFGRVPSTAGREIRCCGQTRGCRRRRRRGRTRRRLPFGRTGLLRFLLRCPRRGVSRSGRRFRFHWCDIETLRIRGRRRFRYHRVLSG